MGNTYIFYIYKIGVNWNYFKFKKFYIIIFLNKNQNEL
jgi:hypothetical protein